MKIEETDPMIKYEDILSGKEKISLIGLGYVGMPIAINFSKKAKVIGYDVNAEKIVLYNSGYDPTKEVGHEAIKNSLVEFTSDESKLREAGISYCSGSDSCQARSYIRFGPS